MGLKKVGFFLVFLEVFFFFGSDLVDWYRER